MGIITVPSFGREAASVDAEDTTSAPAVYELVFHGGWEVRAGVHDPADGARAWWWVEETSAEGGVSPCAARDRGEDFRIGSWLDVVLVCLLD